ncbi:MAG: ABC transporter substrate-binding protein [Actinomycetales bacterium]|nr:ABC transporter substrate-binding protein [Actinomycetales bacterium]
MSPFRFSRRAGLAAVATLALTLTACGGDGETTDTASPTTDATTSDEATDDAEAPAETVDLTVGVIPILDVAPIYLGVQEGFFEEEGINLTLELAQGGAAIIPGVVSGQFQFGFSNTISLLLAQDNNLGLKAIANGAQSTDDPMEDFGAVVVPGDSDIQDLTDLEGKRIGVNTLNNIQTTTINQLVREAGGDPSTITYVELPFPDIVQAVANRDVDAGQLVEPFRTLSLNAGDRNLGSNLAGVVDNMEVAMYFTSQAYADENPDIVERFTRAINKSLQYADENPVAAREILGTYTNIDPAVAEAAVLPRWPGEINRDTVQLLAELAVGDGLISAVPDLDVLLP